MHDISDGYLTKRQLRDRYKKSSKTIREWELNGVLPPPDTLIAGRKYWKLSTLEQAERDGMSRREAEAATNSP
jgi:hypothetical protein